MIRYGRIPDVVFAPSTIIHPVYSQLCTHVAGGPSPDSDNVQSIVQVTVSRRGGTMYNVNKILTMDI